MVSSEPKPGLTILRQVMRIPAFLAAAAILALAGCSSDHITGLEQMVFNATFTGKGTVQRSPGDAALAAPEPATVTMTLGQLGQDFSGTWTITPVSSASALSGGVNGRTTPFGADFTFVESPPCNGTLHGSFTVTNGELTGSAAGRDCVADGSAGTANNVQITFTNLVRQ
jgi:hypothetical protein